MTSNPAVMGKRANNLAIKFQGGDYRRHLCRIDRIGYQWVSVEMFSVKETFLLIARRPLRARTRSKNAARTFNIAIYKNRKIRCRQ